MEANQAVNQIDLSNAVAPVATGSALVGTAKYRATILNFLKRMSNKIMAYFGNPENLKKPQFWILIAVFLRFAYVFMNERGWNPFKKNITGDHVFLTGAGGGIGKLMALRLGLLGCKLSLSDINTEILEKCATFLVSKGVPAENIFTFRADMSNIESIKNGAQLARNKFGDVHILINNAGIVSGKQTMELTEAEIDRTFQVNTISHLHTIREFIPSMKANKKGHIVSIASMAGLVGVSGLSDYCASKFGAVAIDETLRYELAKSGHSGNVKTTCICPYFINTGMFDGAKQAWPMYILDQDRVADRVIAAIRQEEAQVLIPYRGNVLYIMKLLPISLADWVGNLLGMHNSMDDFTGKGDKRMPGLDLKK